MYQFGVLIFTGKGTGKAGREVRQATGEDYFCLGTLNRDRTVAAAIVHLCGRQKRCTDFDVYIFLRQETQRLMASGKFPREFPDPDAEFEYMSQQDVKRHIRSVIKRSADPTTKYIPHNIIQEGGYITLRPMMRIVS